MFIPYEVDAPFDHRPVVNWIVLGGIILVFILQVVTAEKWAEKPKKTTDRPIIEDVISSPTVEEEPTNKQTDNKQAIAGPMTMFALNGWGIGLFTYIWLHGGILKGTVKLISNLIFLWPLGNAVCSKLGNKLYPLVYLGFGLMAGIIHLILSSRPAVGACGALSGIVGMYIVLFPENSISCFFLLPRPMAASISGYWVVLLWFIVDLAVAGLGGQSTTYCAHILCVGAGAGLAVLMLKKKWLVMEKDEKSLLQVLSKGKEEIEEERKDMKTLAQGQIHGAEKSPDKVDKAITEPNPVSSASHAPVKDDLQRKTAAETKKPDDDFIRFRCECGHRIKVRKKDAGKTGRCPKCSRWVEAPRE